MGSVRKRDPLRPTIGLMIDDLDGDYQLTIWAGVEEAAKEADVNVICFLGGEVESTYETRHLYNSIYNLISPESLDGLIVVSTVLATYIGNERLREYCKRFEPLPMVSLGFRLKGMNSIIVDNQFGLKAIMNHLIEDHGYRKFLFLAGTANNADAAERKRIFIDSLKAHHIPVNKDLIKQGEFRPGPAYKIINELLDQKYEFEAIVAANDEMAHGAMKALLDRNIILPEHAAITGFDDIKSSRFMVLPLTTVRQPTFEMSKKAMELLLKKIRKEKIPELEMFKTEVVIRCSCGCFSNEAIQAGITEEKSTENITKKDFTKIKETILKEILTNGSQNLLKTKRLWFETILDSFYKEISGSRQNNNFLPLLDKILRQSSLAGIDDSIWENFISVLRKTVVPHYAGQYSVLIKAENLFHQARVMIKDMAKRVQSNIRFSLAEKTRTLQFVIDTFIGSFDIQTLLNNLAAELPRIGVKSCSLSMHTSESKMFQEARLIMAYNEKERLEIGEDGYIYPARHIFPRNKIKPKKRYNIILEPLIFRNEQLGFISMEMNPLEGIQSLALSEQIRSALKASKMMQEMKAKDKELSELDRLKNDFIANITHDFRSHITIVLNSAELGMRYDSPDNFTEIIQRYNTIYNASLKLKMTIDRLLDLAKMDAHGIKLKIQKLDVKSYLKNIVHFYQSACVSSQIKIQCRLPANDIDNFYTDLDKLEEIMHNLISNALKFVDPNKGIITISLIDNGSSIEIIVSDNGIGIPRDKLSVIFGRFEQLEDGRNSKYKGTGIGLAFAKELTGYLRGSIRAESNGPGKGASFILELKKDKNIYSDLEIIEDNEIQNAVSLKRNQFQTIVESNLKDNLQIKEISTHFTNLNGENEFNPQKGVILIADDDPVILEIVKEYLKKAGYENFITASNGKDGLEAIYQYKPDLIICDYNMPKMHGDEMQDIIISNQFLKRIPVLFLTAISDKYLMLERKKKGALTILNKPLDEYELLVNVEIYLKKHMEYLQLLSQASLDELTGLANKPAIFQFLTDQLMIRAYHSLSLIFVDIDRFKMFNSTYGYPAGDIFLSHIGKLIKDSIRNYDRAGFYGGGKFLIILPEAGINEACSVAEKLQSMLKSSPVTIGNKKKTVTVSFGISSLMDNSRAICESLKIENLRNIFEAEDIKSADWEFINKIKKEIRELLIDMADKALIEAKKSGRDKIVSFHQF